MDGKWDELLKQGIMAMKNEIDSQTALVIKQANEAIDTIKKKLTEAENKINEELSKLDKILDNKIQSKFAEIQRTLTTELTNFRSILDELKRQTAQQTQDIQKNITNVTNQIVQINTKQTDFHTTVNNIKKQLDELQGKTQKMLDERINKEFTRFQNLVNSNSQQINQLTQKVDTISQELTNLKNMIKDLIVSATKLFS